MNASEVLAYLNANTHLKDIRIDSRELKPGDIFIAMPGSKTDGRQYMQSAVDKGSALIIYESQNFTPPALPIPSLPMENLAKHLPQIVASYYGAPSKGLKVIGITGTNGKTSTTQYIAQLLGAQNLPCGVMGTLGSGIYPDLQTRALTTSDCATIQLELAKFLKAKVPFVAMEVSSIGLDQGRLLETQIDTAIFSNLTQDHLDYHQTMEAYFAAKCRLFTEFNAKHCIINIDDEYGRKLINLIPATSNVITYSRLDANADLYLHNDWLQTPWGEGKLITNLMGAFNQSNVLAAIAACAVQGLKLADILRVTSNLKPVCGRMELIPGKAGDPRVIVDYAHTPDALVNALRTLREYKPRKLFCIFGCGGDRDRAKRPLMMQAVAMHSDEIVVTRDNPRTEDANQIVNDMLKDTKTANNVTVELDRKLAIENTIKRATCDDIILIAGKGHEDYQIIGTTKYPFSDQLVAKEALGVTNANNLCTNL